MAMTRVPEISRLFRSWLPRVLVALLFVVCVPWQGFAARSLAKPAQQGAEATQDAKQVASPDATPQPASIESPEEIRQEKIKADTKKLYQLSAELRAEVAKTYKESLSLSVLRKAEEIEKLARGLKALMNQEAAASR